MRRFALALFASGLLLSPSSAQPLEQFTLLGHTLTIAKSEDGRSTQVLVNGMVLYENTNVTIEKVQIIDGAPVALGWASGEDDDCAQSPFVLSVPTPGNARLDGPIKSCATVSVHPMDDGLQFVEDAASAQKWRWTSADGFSEIASD